MSSIQIQVSGDRDALLKRLKDLQDIDKKGVNNAIAEGLRTSTMERFQTEKGPDNKKWIPSIRSIQSGGKTMTKTTKLRTSIKTEASSEGLAIGTNDIRAATLQLGDTRTIRAKNKSALYFEINGIHIMKKQVTVTIPARPFLGISDEDQDEIMHMLDEMMKG